MHCGVTIDREEGKRKLPGTSQCGVRAEELATETVKEQRASE